MQYRTLGRTGIRVSELGVGGAQFGIPDYMGKWDPWSEEALKQTTATVHHAIEMGYTYFDTAPGYGDGRSEELYGVALKGKRDQVTLATKINAGQWTPEKVRASVMASLRRLQTDVIDVIQFHGGWYDEGEAETILSNGAVDELEKLRDEGVVRFIGFTTEGPSGGVEQLIATGRFDTMQIRYNLLHQHASDFSFAIGKGIIRKADAQGMGIILMRPLTSGVFQRLMAAEFPELDQMKVGRLLLNYVLSDPYVDVALIGMREPRWVDINAAISDDVASRLDLSQVHYRFAK